jgi:hypothetical protein
MKRSTAVVVICVAGLIGILLIAYVVMLDHAADAVSDRTVNSRTIQLSDSINPGPEHPLAGLWKTECKEDFGLAIAAAGKDLYSVSFCGPGGCFKPGTYRPNTSLVGDPAYKIESTTRVLVMGVDEKFTPYTRCWPAQ